MPPDESEGSVACKYCGRSGLVWKKIGTRWILHTESGIVHQCYRKDAAKLEFYKEAYGGGTQPQPTTDVDSILKEKVDAKMLELVSILNTTTEVGVKQLQVLRDDVIANAVEKAIIAAKSVTPVKHEFQIKVDNLVRSIDGHPHKYLPTLIQVAAQRLHVFMVGPAGSGKTTAASQTAKALKLPYFESSMGPATSQWDLLGFRNANGDYVPGIMREPYEHGGILMLDEMDNSNPSVLTVLNSALSNGRATFPDGNIPRHKDFICIAAGNTYGLGADRLYVGRNQLDAATLDRFVVLNWDYDEDAERTWAGVDQVEWTQFVQRVRSIIFKHNMRIVVSPRASIFGAKLLRCGMNKDVVAEIVLWKGISRDDRARIKAEVGVL